MTRDQAMTLLKEFTHSESLLKHAYAVEAAMRAYAGASGADVELWGMVGLLHDFDYEMYPEAHPMKGSEILKGKGVALDIRQAILGHADFSGVPRTTAMAKTLYAVDELCGFITAVTLVKPSRSVSEVSAQSVKKKMKDKSFAAKVNREEIRKGAEQLNVDFEKHVEFVVSALSKVAEKLGLNP
jgi:predicted hydrolase (HD superfamily)